MVSKDGKALLGQTFTTSTTKKYYGLVHKTIRCFKVIVR